MRIPLLYSLSEQKRQKMREKKIDKETLRKPFNQKEEVQA